MEEIEPRYRCQTCGDEFDTIEDFQRHVQEEHETQPIVDPELT